MMLYRFVDDQKAEGFPVRLVCSVVGVSPSAPRRPLPSGQDQASIQYRIDRRAWWRLWAGRWGWVGS